MSLTGPLSQPPRATQMNQLLHNPTSMAQQPPIHAVIPGSRNPAGQRPPTKQSAVNSPSMISSVLPQNGMYIITQVHSAGEFYGYSQSRERELQDIHQCLERYYNTATNDQSFSSTLFVDGYAFVIQQDEKYHRVIIKHRESDTRVLVKLVDRGDELMVDTSELLKMEQAYQNIPAFSQPFRLYSYDESQHSSSITRVLKQLILGKCVNINLQAPPHNGFHPVEVTLSTGESVNQLVLSNNRNVISSISGNRPNFNSQQQNSTASQMFNNTPRFQSTAGQDPNAHVQLGQRGPNNLLSMPRMAIETPPARFGGGNRPSLATAAPSFEPTTRFPATTNRNQPQQAPLLDPTPLNSAGSDGQNKKSSFPTGKVSHPSMVFTRTPNSFQSDGHQRSNDTIPTATYNKEPTSSEPKRPFTSGPSGQSRYGQQTSERTNDNNFRREDGFSNRGGSVFDRGGRGGFNTRSTNENSNEEKSPATSGGFSRHGEGFGNRGDHSGHVQDRTNFHRNRSDNNNENTMSPSNNNRGEYGERRGGGFHSQRGHGNNGTFERRGGGFNDRRGEPAGRGARGGRGGFSNWDSGFEGRSEGKESGKTLSGWPNTNTAIVNFEAGDHFRENELPKDTFKFVVSHIETPNDFFIQFLSKEAEIKQLTASLQTECKQSPEIDLNSLKTNQPCLAKHSDKCWYRAMVLSIATKPIQIRFIDFGDTANTDVLTTRQLAKKYCSAAPYAYRCTFTDMTVVPNSKIEYLINKCAGEVFHGKMQRKNADGQFVLQSDDLRKIFLETNALQLKPEFARERIKCVITQIYPSQHRFYIQDDFETTKIIEELVEKETSTASTFSNDDLKQISSNTMVIAMFEEGPYRGIIESDDTDDEVKVYYVDFGNTSSCSKSLLKRCSEQLSSYPHQAKQCQLYDVSPNELEKAFTFLENHSDADSIEISIVNKNENLLNVLIFIDNQCANEQFGYDPTCLKNAQTNAKIVDESNVPAAATPEVHEHPVPIIEKQQTDEIVLPPVMITEVQELPAPIVEKQQTDEIISSNEDEQNVPTAIVPDKAESDREVTSSNQRTGLLTHIESDRPYIYLQLIPESESILVQINELIDEIIQDTKHDASYNIGDYIIAQFSEDDNYYRGRLDSYSSASQMYTVYFLDYGNTDENVPIDHLFSYSKELKDIEPLARGYLLNEINTETWKTTVRPLMEKEKLNDIVQFIVVDESTSVIQMIFDFEETISNLEENINELTLVSNVEETQTFQAIITGIDNTCFYIRKLPDGESRVCELNELLQKCVKEHRTTGTWSINDSCLVSNEQDEYYRGQIVAIEEKRYDVKCIDYGNVLQNITDDHLYVLPIEEILAQTSLAHQCRLHDVDDAHQSQAIEERIRHIQPTEPVTISVKNDLDALCWFVEVSREINVVVDDNEQDKVKQQSDIEKKDDSVSLDSAISDDDDPSGTNDDLATSTNDMSVQVENNNQTTDTIYNEEQNALSLMSNNQTIDFGENDPSTTIKDEINSSISST